MLTAAAKMDCVSVEIISCPALETLIHAMKEDANVEMMTLAKGTQIIAMMVSANVA